MSLRVIAGSAKGRRLKMVPGDSTRPVMDRVKEACFSIIGRQIIDSRFLDMFAGTGSVGIEALSRGAAESVFLEMNGKAIHILRENIETTGFSDQAIIRRGDSLAYLKSNTKTPFDFIYIAPPQFKSIWLDAMKILDENPEWLTEDSIVIVQIAPSEKQDFAFKNLVAYDERKYGNTLLWFFHTADAANTET